MRQPEPPARLTLESYDDWASLARELVEPALEFQTPARSEIRLPGRASWHGDRADGLEGFARVLLLEALAGCQEAGVGACAMRLLEGVAVGVGSSDARWIRASENRHALVEGASVALALWVGGHRLWRALAPETQSAVTTWLAECADLYPTLDNNWMLFAFAINRFLTGVGAPHPQSALIESRSRERLNELYRGGGWYSDDGPATFDYYNSFSYHLFPGLVAYLDDDRELIDQSVERLEAFLPSLTALISPDGAPVYFGRSMTYRSAIASPLGVASLLGIQEPAPATAREMAAGVVNFFVGLGGIVPGAPILPGWGPHDSDLVHDYSGPGAAYWAAQTFVSLLLPRDHPYWRPASHSRSEPPRSRYIPETGLLLSSTDSIARLANHGSYDTNATDIQERTDDPFYGRLGYSSATLPLVGEIADNAFTVISGEGRFRRGRIAATGGGADWAASDGWLRDLDSGAELSSPARFCTVSMGNWDIHFLAFPELASHDGELRNAMVTVTGWACAALPNSDVSGVARGKSVTLASGVSATRLHGMLGLTSARIIRGSRPATRWALAELSGRDRRHVYAASSVLSRSADEATDAPPTVSRLTSLTWRLRARGYEDRIVRLDRRGFSVQGG